MALDGLTSSRIGIPWVWDVHNGALSDERRLVSRRRLPLKVLSVREVRLGGRLVLEKKCRIERNGKLSCGLGRSGLRGGVPRRESDTTKIPRQDKNIVGRRKLTGVVDIAMKVHTKENIAPVDVPNHSSHRGRVAADLV